MRGLIKKTPKIRGISIILLSPTNQLLLLHRVRTSSSFASAHVFPGGNLSAFHEGPIPGPDSPARHRDGEAYRLGAIRETFEESGILLARRRRRATPSTSGEGGDQQQLLLDLPEPVREAGRRAVHAGSARFVDWLAGAGGVADVGGLVPFTRWVTPANMAPRRFTTQMYLYMLPTECPEEEDCSAEVVGAPGAPGGAVVIPKPTHDGGVEHTAAAFDSVEGWLARARAGEIILFPPQMYLLTLLARFLTGPPGGAAAQDEGLRRRHYEGQRDALRAFLAREPGGGHPTGRIGWADKVMSPRLMFMRRADGRSVLGVDGPGPELKGSGRGGDWERVVLVRFGPEGPREVEVRSREEVLEEEREAERREVEEDKRAQGTVAGKL